MSKLEGRLSDGRKRCQARKIYGSAWIAGREQCSNAATQDDVLCGTHARQLQKRFEEKIRQKQP